MLAEHAVRAAAGRGAGTGPRPAEAAAADPPRLILVVDQFEELFTARRQPRRAGGVHRGAARRRHLPGRPAQAPAGAGGRGSARGLPGRLIGYPPLRAALDAGPFTVGPMSEAELRLAITGPAAEAGLAVEPALVEAVTAELREGAGAGRAAACCR